MKRIIILLELLKLIRFDRGIKRKLKIFATIGAIGLVISIGITVWIGMSALRYVSTRLETFDAQDKFQRVETYFQSLPSFSIAGCVDGAQTLMSHNGWQSIPIKDYYVNLKRACLKDKESACEGALCRDLNESVSANESHEWI